jgi:hypothetical protein
LYAAYAAGVWRLRAPGESWRVTLASCAFFPACQVAWTAGLLRGLLTAPRTAAPGPAGARLEARAAGKLA